MRKAIVLLALVVSTMAFAPAAMAGAPVEITEEVTFEDVNPCSGEVHEVSIVFSIALHEHPNNVVLVVSSAATTSDGFEGSGHEATVFTSNNQATTLNFVIANPDTGDMFTVKGNLKLVQGEVHVDNFTFNCVRDA